jgi:hypothetical protein
MSWRLRKAVRRWLAAEAFGSADAERCLDAVFRRLPITPPPGFAARVLERAGLGARRRDAFARRPVRLAIAGGLLLAGCAAVLLPALVPVLARLVSLAALVEAGTGALAAGGGWLGRAFSLLDVFTDLGRLAGDVAATPPAAAALVAAVALAAAALRVLAQLISSERSTRYVDSN